MPQHQVRGSILSSNAVAPPGTVTYIQHNKSLIFVCYDLGLKAYVHLKTFYVQHVFTDSLKPNAFFY